MGPGTHRGDDGASYDGQRAMVLGAGGFIGRWLARSLGEAGAEVCCVCRPRGRRPQLPGQCASIDLEDPQALGAAIAAWTPSIIFNASGYGVCPGQGEDARSHAINVALPRDLAKGLVAEYPRDKRPALIHLGSALEYGDVRGDLDPLGPAQPTTLYGRHKLQGVQGLLPHFESGELRGGIARPFTVYGPEDNPHKLLPFLFRAAQSEGPIPLTAGAQERDFIYIKDVTRLLLALGLQREPTPAIVNLATGRLTSLRQMIALSASLLGIDSQRLDYGALPTRREEMTHAPVSLKALKARLGDVAFTPLEVGLTRSIALMTGTGGAL